MHNFINTFKVLMKNKGLVFWTFIFPIVLGTFFNLAFADIEKNEKLDMIDIAIVEDENFSNSAYLRESFKVLSDTKNEERYFNTTYVKTEEEASKLLDSDKVIGYLKVEEVPNVIIKKNGIDQTVFNYVTNELVANSNIINDILNKTVQNGKSDAKIEELTYAIYQNVTKELMESEVAINDTTRANLSYTMIEFYTLIAMTCLYSGMIGMVAINYNLPNMGSIGKRIAVSPNKKGRIILSSALASYAVSLIGLIILFLYTIFVLNVDYGSNMFLVILLSLVGLFAGLALGIFVATMLKTNENNKTGILIAFTMLGCFLSGMMGVTMKYVIDKNLPFINMINPAAMITDGFYALYYYDTLHKFCFNLFSLLIFAGVLLFISSFSLRRQQYDSI